MSDKKTHGMTGLRNAAKPVERKKTGNIQFRCDMTDKSGWVKTAKSDGLTLSSWIIKTLNSARKF